MNRKRESGGRRRMNGLLPEVIGLLPNAARLRESMAIPFWADAVGDQAAKASRVEQVHDGIIFVLTKSSVWSHELNLHQEEILHRINRRLGGDIIKKIVLRPDAEFTVKTTEMQYEPTMEELESQELSRGEQKQLETQLTRLESIKVPAIRTAIGNQIRTAVLLQHWRLMHGWKLCRECNTAFEEGSDLCPLCRLNLTGPASQWREQ